MTELIATLATEQLGHDSNKWTACFSASPQNCILSCLPRLPQGQVLHNQQALVPSFWVLAMTSITGICKGTRYILCESPCKYWNNKWDFLDKDKRAWDVLASQRCLALKLALGLQNSWTSDYPLILLTYAGTAFMHIGSLVPSEWLFFSPSLWIWALAWLMSVLMNEWKGQNSSNNVLTSDTQQSLSAGLGISL